MARFSEKRAVPGDCSFLHKGSNRFYLRERANESDRN